MSGKTIEQMRQENPRFDKDLEITFHLADKARQEPTPDQYIQRYLFLRDFVAEQSKKFADWAKPINEEMESISSRLHEHLLALGGDKPSIKTAHGTAFTTTSKNPRISDRDAYLDFVLGDAWDTYGNAMLQVGTPQVSAVTDYMDAHDGQLPPGVKVEPFTKISIRKS